MINAASNGANSLIQAWTPIHDGKYSAHLPSI